MKLNDTVVWLAIFFVLRTCISSGIYDVNEVRSVLYEPDIFSVIAGIDPSFNLSTVSSQNKAVVVEKIIADLPNVGDEEYVFVKNKAGQSFACKLPKVQVEEKAQPASYNPKYLAELVSASFYVKNCISKESGWWNYKLCRGIDVKQWHGAKNEAEQTTNSLGMFFGKYDIPSFQTSTPERLMYLEEHYEGGTLCDLPDKKSPRKTAVRYECDPQLSTSEAYIDHVEEAASCEYIITVKVGSLCSLKPFMPPNLIKPNKIVCQPFVSKEAVKKFLDDTIRKRTEMKEAAERARSALDLVRRIQRRRASMRRTELLRDPSERLKLRKHLDAEYQLALTKYIECALQAKLGEFDGDVSETVELLSREADDIEKTFYWFDYLTERDQDAGNLWYYFHDRTWNKTHYPKSLNYVDIMNGYYNAATDLIKKEPNIVLASKLFRLIRKDPWNPEENVLLHGGISSTIRSAVLQDVPSFIAHNEYSLDDEMANNIGSGHGVFGFRADRNMALTVRTNTTVECDERASKIYKFKGKLCFKACKICHQLRAHISSVVNAFMSHVRVEFVNGREPLESNEDIENALGIQLVPAYRYIELLLMQDKMALSDHVRQNIASDMVRMLDRLCVAYELAKIRFDLEQPDHKLSFVGIGAEMRSNILFDEYYDHVVRGRSEQEKTEINERLRAVMTSLLEQYRNHSFHEQWFMVAEALLYKQREEDTIKYGKQSRDTLKSAFFDGKIVLTNTDIKDVMSLMNAAGLQVDDMRMEVISMNVVDGAQQKFSAEEMRLLQEVIKRQMDDLRDIKRITQREQAYAAVLNG